MVFQLHNICIQVSNYCSQNPVCFPKNNYYITNRKREIFKSAISFNALYLRIKFSLSLYSTYLYLKKSKSTDNCYLLTFTGEVHAKGLCFCAAKVPGDKFHGFLQDPANYLPEVIKLLCKFTNAF